jgi:glycosyltransferase involved in cell wall biosynthesis
MNVLHIAGGLPTAEKPYYQPFIQSQINSLSSKGINIVTLDLKGYESSFNYVKYLKKIKRIVKGKNIQLIHTHYVYCGLSALLAYSGLPIVLSLMGDDIYGSSNFKGEVTIKGRLERNLSKIVSRYVNWIIVKSNRMKEYLKVNVPVDVIPNGINFNIFKPMGKCLVRKEMSIPKDTFIVLFLGNPNVINKNYLLAKNSVDYLIGKFNTNNIKLIAPFGISQNEVVKYLNVSDALLLTSYSEGSPNVVKEAMACNLPVVSTDVGDVEEIITGTKNCFLVPYDADVISQKLKIIYDNRERSNGRERIDHLRDEVISDKIIDIYRKLINDRKRCVE